MKKLSYTILFFALILGTSIRTFANDPEEVVILSKIFEIEQVQSILSEENQVIITNGLVSEKIQIYIDESQINMQSQATESDIDYLNIEKYNAKGESAKILIVNENVKIKVKLKKEDNEWKVKSCYIKNGKSIYASVEF